MNEPTQSTCYVMVPCHLMTELSNGEYKVYSILVSHVNLSEQRYACWPTLQRIADIAGMKSAEQVGRYIRRMRERGYLRTERRFDNSSIYYPRYLVINGAPVDLFPDTPVQNDPSHTNVCDPGVQNDATLPYDHTPPSRTKVAFNQTKELDERTRRKELELAPPPDPVPVTFEIKERNRQERETMVQRIKACGYTRKDAVHLLDSNDFDYLNAMLTRIERECPQYPRTWLARALSDGNYELEYTPRKESRYERAQPISPRLEDLYDYGYGGQGIKNADEARAAGMVETPEGWKPSPTAHAAL